MRVAHFVANLDWCTGVLEKETGVMSEFHICLMCWLCLGLWLSNEVGFVDERGVGHERAAMKAFEPDIVSGVLALFPRGLIRRSSVSNSD